MLMGNSWQEFASIGDASMTLPFVIRTRRAASALAYGLVLGLISVGAISTVDSVGRSVTGLFDDVSTDLAGGAPCAANSADGGTWSHAALTHRGITTGTRSADAAPGPVGAEAWRYEARIACDNGTATANGEQPVASQCEVGRTLVEGACVLPAGCPAGASASGFTLATALPAGESRTVTTNAISGVPGTPARATGGSASGAATCTDGSLSVDGGSITFTITACENGYSPSTDQSRCVPDMLTLASFGTGPGAYLAWDDASDDGVFASSCEAYIRPPEAGRSYSAQDGGSGVYRIDADGEAAGFAPTNVYCDMDNAGGGWTLITQGRPVNDVALRLDVAGAVGTLDLTEASVSSPAKMSDAEINAISVNNQVLAKFDTDNVSTNPAVWSDICWFDMNAAWSWTSTDGTNPTPAADLDSPNLTCVLGSTYPSTTSISDASSYDQFFVRGVSLIPTRSGSRFFIWTVSPNYNDTYIGGACNATEAGRSWLAEGNYGCNTTKWFIR